MKNFIQIIINGVYSPFTRSSERNHDVIICCLNELSIIFNKKIHTQHTHTQI